MQILKYWALILFNLPVITGCNKFLSEKSDKSLVIPSELKYLQGLLDNEQGNQKNYVTLGEQSADDFFVPEGIFNGALKEHERNIYLWEGVYIYDVRYTDWEDTYKAIYVFSVTLKRLADIERTPKNQVDWDNIKGQALALRSYQYLSAVLAWAKAYDPLSSEKDLGVPIRNTDDFSEQSVRSSVTENYEEIIKSLKEAIPLLPNQPYGAHRASKPMAYATLARTFLAMRNYKDAALYADSAFKINSTLLDYNTVSGNLFLEPFYGNSNPDILLYWEGSSTTRSALHALAYHRVDTFLYSQFEAHDLRKRLFFVEHADGYFAYNGNYTGSEQNRFCGISIPEIYLTLAECYARDNKISEAMQKLNDLLINRYDKNEPFIPSTASNKEEALTIVLEERRKELMFRGLRWMDIKRLNMEGANIVLTRKMGGKTYTLPPNDNRYALPLPEDIIELSGMQQNPQ